MARAVQIQFKFMPHRVGITCHAGDGFERRRHYSSLFFPSILDLIRNSVDIHGRHLEHPLNPRDQNTSGKINLLPIAPPLEEVPKNKRGVYVILQETTPDVFLALFPPLFHTWASDPLRRVTRVQKRSTANPPPTFGMTRISPSTPLLMPCA